MYHSGEVVGLGIWCARVPHHLAVYAGCVAALPEVWLHDRFQRRPFEPVGLLLQEQAYDHTPVDLSGIVTDKKIMLMNVFAHMGCRLWFCYGGWDRFSAFAADASRRTANQCVGGWIPGTMLANRTESTPPQSLYGEGGVVWSNRFPRSRLWRGRRFGENSDYQQHIVTALNIQPAEDDKSVIVRFVKRAGTTGKMTNYPEEILLMRDAAGWQSPAKPTALRVLVKRKVPKLRGTYWPTFELRLASRGKSTDGGACSDDSDCDCSLWSSDAEDEASEVIAMHGRDIETLSGLDDSGRDRVMVSPQWWSSVFRVVYLF